MASPNFSLEFVPLEVTTTPATYGGSIGYGEGTYGQEASDPVSNINYVAVPFDGEYSVSPNWSYRTGDAQTFEATFLGLDGRMDLTPIRQAWLIIERLSAGPRLARIYACEVDENAGVVRRRFSASDLDVTGMFRVLIALKTDSGRRITVDATDDATMVIRAGGA